MKKRSVRIKILKTFITFCIISHKLKGAIELCQPKEISILIDLFCSRDNTQLSLCLPLIITLVVIAEGITIEPTIILRKKWRININRCSLLIVLFKIILYLG